MVFAQNRGYVIHAMMTLLMPRNAPVATITKSKFLTLLVIIILLSSSKGICSTDNGTLHNLFYRAKQGEHIVIAAIGGSITQGARASSVEKRWINLVGQWFKKTIPEGKYTIINAGIGATGSARGAIRIRQYVEHLKPDIVFIEFCVNDYAVSNYNPSETMEGLIRQLNALQNKPVIILVCNARADLGTAEKKYEQLTKHYNIQLISILPHIKKVRKNKELNLFFQENDIFHPSDRGHRYIANEITKYLNSFYSSESKEKTLNKTIPQPPLFSNKYEKAVLLNAENYAPSHNSGWFVTGTKGHWWGLWWESSTPESTLTFDIECTDIGIIFHQEKSGYGAIEVQIDELEPVTLDGYWENDWGGGQDALRIIASDLTSEKHELKIKLLSNKNKKSSSHLFKLKGLSVAGCLQSFCDNIVKKGTLSVPKSITVY